MRVRSPVKSARSLVRPTPALLGVVVLPLGENWPDETRTSEWGTDTNTASAVLDPPTPTGESRPTFDTARIELPKRRRRRFRSYWSTDDESSDNDSSSSSSSDDEPPWWTFTQRGMAKLRSRDERPTPPHPITRGSLSEAPNDSAGASDVDSGRDSARERPQRRQHRMPFASMPSRQNSNGSSAPTPTRDAASRLFHPRALRATFARRSSDMNGETHAGEVRPSASTDDSGAVIGADIPRSTSAPIPEGDIPVASPSRVSSPERPDATDGDTDTPSRNRRPRPKRFLSMPQRRSQDDAPLTDSEATMAYTSPRVRARQRMWTIGTRHGTVAEEEGANDEAAESDTALDGGAGQRPRRLNTQHLRLRLPTPVSEHFAGGWPHAGSWQHALHYGIMDENGDEIHRRHSVDVMRRHSHDLNALVSEPDHLPNDSANGNGNASSVHASSLQGHGNTGYRTSVANDTDTSAVGPRPRGLHLDLTNLETPPRAKRKTKSRRTRRYRPALVPPTPGPGTSFNADRSVIGADVWGNNAGPTPDPDTNPFDRVNPFDRIDEEYPFSDEACISEKVGMFGHRRKARPLDKLDWRKRIRRMLFLDARVTVYIRLFNLAIAVTLLALALTIRLRVSKLGVRGIIGPSTTLIISFSCLTIVHVLTAIYREYFGRPIGLWGLRSKMLWVCLDLLFIALWSSAATLAINDYIITPLDCTPLSPWWSQGTEYVDAIALVTRGVEMAAKAASSFERETPVPAALKFSAAAKAVCRRQVGCFAVSLVALLLYCGNMVLSLFRIFETVRRTANPIRTISV